MCLFTSARTVAIIFARSAGSAAMHCAGSVHDGEGQTGSFPFSEASSHYEPSESRKTNIRKRPVCPRVSPSFPRVSLPKRLKHHISPRRGSASRWRKVTDCFLFDSHGICCKESESFVLLLVERGLFGRPRFAI